VDGFGAGITILAEPEARRKGAKYVEGAASVLGTLRPLRALCASAVIVCKKL